MSRGLKNQPEKMMDFASLYLVFSIIACVCFVFFLSISATLFLFMPANSDDFRMGFAFFSLAILGLWTGI